MLVNRLYFRHTTRKHKMTFVICKTVNRVTYYLSTTGKFVKSKSSATCFPTPEMAQVVADKNAARVTTYKFRQ